MRISVLIIVLIAVVGFGVAIDRKRLKSFDLLSPPILFGCLVLLGFLLPLAGILDGSDSFTNEYRTPAGTADVHLNKALIIVILGALGFYLGFFLGVRGRHRIPWAERLVKWKPPALIFGIAGLSILGLALFSVGIVFVGGLSAALTGMGHNRLRQFEGIYYFMKAGNLLLAAGAVWWMYLLSKRRLWSVYFALFAVFAMGVVALQGTKSLIVVTVATAVILFHVLYKRISPTRVLAGALMTVMVYSAYGVVMREYLSVGYFVTIDPKNITWDALVGVLERETKGNNFVQMQTLLAAVRQYPRSNGYQWGRTYLSLFAMPIPRAWWGEDKPVTAPGVFTEHIWPVRYLLWGTTVPPGLLGEMYMNFGLIGVLPSSLFFGLLYGWITRVRLEIPKMQYDILYALLVAAMPHYIRGDMVTPTILVLSIYLPARFLLAICSRESIKWQSDQTVNRAATAIACPA